MATDKRFVVKNGLQTENINFVFNDAVLGSSNITATMLSSNTLSFSGTTGQLFSITDSMTGVIFAVNDISGVPSIEVYDDGRVYFAETFGNVTIGNSTISSSRTSTSTTTGILQVAGGVGITGNINVGGTRNLFTGSVGIGTSIPLGTNANVFSVYGTEMVYGNISLRNPTGGTSGVYFNDGTYQTTAFTGATQSFGVAGTIQYAGAGNTFAGNSDNFFWDSANNRLGIGTNTPTNVLTVRSTATPAWFNTINSAVGSNNFEIIVGNGASTGTTVGYVNNTLVPYGYLSTGTSTRNIVIAANGRVGIGGITAPQVLLDVGGTTVIGASWAGNSNFINPPANGLAVQGAVGIGTYTPLGALDVRGGVGVTAASNFGGTVSVASLISNGAISGTTITGTAGTFTSIQNSGQIRSTEIVSNTWIHATQNLTVASSNTSTTTGTGALVVTGGVGIGGNLNVGGTNNSFTSNVGIGITTPTARLHTYQTITAQKSPAIVVGAAYSAGDLSHGVAFSINNNPPAAGMYVNDGGAGSASLTFTTSPNFTTPTNVERMRISAAGNVMIGTSTVTPAGLAVVSNINNSASPLAALDAAAITIRNDSVGGLNLAAKLNFNVATVGASVISGYYAAFNASNDIGTGLIFGTQTNAAGGTVERMRIDQNGNVAIGTTAAGARLVASYQTTVPAAASGIPAALNNFFQFVAADGNSNRLVLDTAGGSAASIVGRVSGGTAASPSATPSGTILMTMTTRGYGATGWLAGTIGAISLNADATFTDTSSPTFINFSTTPTNAVAATERMRIDSNGNVGIATTTIQTGFTLQTQGNQSVSNRIGVGTTAIAGVVNTAAVFGTANIHGNVRLLTPTGGTAGVYFADGTYQTTAFTGSTGTPSFGTVGTIQVAGAANAFTGDSGTFVFDVANDRLGIGTSAPTNVLSVWSTATPAFFNTINSAVGSNNFEILVGNSTSTGTTVGYVNNTTVPYGYLSTGTSTRNIVISANGRVGIGGVTAPQVLLDIGGTTVIGASWAGNSNFINPPASGLAVQGSVGVGTYSPLSSLDVRGGVGVTAASNFGGAVSVASLTSNGTVSGTTGTFTGALYGASFNTAGTATVASLVSNGAISGTTITGTSGTFTSIQNSGNERSANIVSNTWIHATQNLTVASSNASTSTTTGAAVITGGAGIGGNLNVGGTRNLFTGSVGIGTSAALGTNANVFSVYGTASVYGNIGLVNPAGGTSGIYFADGTYQTTAATSNAATIGTVTFTGNGSTTVYSTLPFTSLDKNNTNVFVNGVYQRKSTYSFSGSTLTFTDGAPANGALIEISVISSVGNVLTYTSNFSKQSFTATAGQTTFTVTSGYLPGAIDVFQNGAKLNNPLDFTAANGTTVILATGAAAGDIIDVNAMGGNLVTISNAVPLTGGTMTGSLGVTSGARSISTSSGAITVTASGGIGVTGNVYAGGNIVLSPASGFAQFWGNTGDTAAQPSFTWNANANTGMYQPAANSVGFSTAGVERARIDASGNVGIGTSTIQTGYKLQVQGGFAATSKSFVIDHPTKQGMKLQYASLEGPENGVYVRGRLKGESVIRLPDYWIGLIDAKTITVNLTAIGHVQNLYVSDIDENAIWIGAESDSDIHCFYTVYAERKDIDKLEVEVR